LLPGDRAGRCRPDDVEWACRLVEEAAVFGSLGWSEILALLAVALFIFGPDKLPQVARDAAKMLRNLRDMAQGARTQLRSELGPEFGDFDFNSLNPKTFVRKHLFEDDDDLLTGKFLYRDPATDLRPRSEPLRDGERPPFDPDTT
jgi:sec-independent protein translocase protein TatB